MPIIQRSLAPLLLRIGVGAVFLLAGLEKVVRGPEFVIPYFSEFGIVWPEISGPVISYFELVGAICLLLGLGTRLLAVMFACEMLVVIAVIRLPDAAVADSVVDSFALLRLEVLLAISATALALLGAGRWSLDAKLHRGRERLRRSEPGGVP
jgi:uncharacterized membrane protein YphA (DoxX/SURF4 family)